MFLVLHVAPGAQGIHHWIYQILGALLIFGAWVFLAGWVERRRRTGRGATGRTTIAPRPDDPPADDDLVAKPIARPSDDDDSVPAS